MLQREIENEAWRTRGSGSFYTCVESDSKPLTSTFYLHYFHHPLPFSTLLHRLVALKLFRSRCVLSRCRTVTISLSYGYHLAVALLPSRHLAAALLPSRYRLSTSRHPTYYHCTVVLPPLSLCHHLSLVHLVVRPLA
jgi:hypothetical protein